MLKKWSPKRLHFVSASGKLGFYHTILVRHSVVFLIARFKPQKNLRRLILPRLRYLHILETAGQAPALLKIPFVFFVGGGSDKADFSRSQIRL